MWPCRPASATASLERVGCGASTVYVGSKDLIVASSPPPQWFFNEDKEFVMHRQCVTVVSIKLQKIKLDNPGGTEERMRKNCRGCGVKRELV